MNKTSPIRDAEGIEVREGDIVHFAYGIPPVGVEAPVIRRDGKLIVITEGHKPSECLLSALERHVGYFWAERKIDRLRSELSEANQRIAELESLARQQDKRIDELMTNEALAQARIAELETGNHNEPERIASVASGCIPADTFIRLRDWLSSEPRKAARNAFTAGIERQLAYAIECSGILEKLALEYDTAMQEASQEPQEPD